VEFAGVMMKLRIKARTKLIAGRMGKIHMFLEQRSKKDRKGNDILLTREQIVKEIDQRGFDFLLELGKLIEIGGKYKVDKDAEKSLKEKKSSVGIIKFPTFDGDKEGLKTWMKQMGLSHMDEYADHIDFYGEHFNRLMKITWKQVRNRLWKSVEVENDVKGLPNGKPLDD
jgi:hypothetical protein